MNAFQRFASRLFFGTSSPYENANISPRRSRVPGSAPRDTVLDLTPGVRSELVRRSRYLIKNSGFLREIVSAMVLYSVGDGIKPQAMSQSGEWNRCAELYFRQWSRHCEVSGRFNLTQCQRLICRALDVDGEIFVAKTLDETGEPKLQLIETHRIGDDNDSDNIIDGITVTPQGKPLAYRLLNDDGKYEDLPAHAVLHIFEPESISQVRGFPSLQHSLNHLIDEAELLALEKHAVKANADIARVLTSSNADADDADFTVGEQHSQEPTDASSVQAILGGKVVRVQSGETITPFESNRPSPTFTGFLEHLRRDSAQGLIPYEFAADSSKVGGAGVRLIVAKADRRFSARQDTLIEQFLRPLWFFIIGNAIASGKLDAVPDWTAVEFTTPRRVTVDAGREAQQTREDIKAGLKNLSDHFAELGMDFHVELENRAREMQFIGQIADKYHLDPRDLYSSFLSTIDNTTPTHESPSNE